MATSPNVLRMWNSSFGSRAFAFPAMTCAPSNSSSSPTMSSFPQQNPPSTTQPIHTNPSPYYSNPNDASHMNASYQQNRVISQQNYDNYHAQYEMQRRQLDVTQMQQMPRNSPNTLDARANIAVPRHTIPQPSDHVYKERDYSRTGGGMNIHVGPEGSTQMQQRTAPQQLTKPPQQQSSTHQSSGVDQKRSTSYSISNLLSGVSKTLSTNSTHLPKNNTQQLVMNASNTSTPTPLSTPTPPGQAGLSNPKGSNNCFLNVVVQLLFHVPIFQTFFLSLHSQKHKCADRNTDGTMRDTNTSRCVFCALQILFTHFRYGTDQTLTPIQLRESLSRAYEASGRFQLFQMDDACEAYQSLIEQLNDSMKHCGIRITCFDFLVQEQSVCPTCKTAGSSLKYTTNLWYINSDEILTAKKKRPQLNFQEIFRRISESERKTCDNPECTDRRPVPVYKKVQVPPVLCIGVTWDGSEDSQRKENIMEFMQLIPETTTVGELFRVSDIKQCQVRLRGVLLYYGMHYSCATFDDRSESYLLFDDHNVRKVGTWNDLVKKCSDGHLLPLLFIFEVLDHPHAELLRMKSEDSPCVSDDTSPMTPLSAAPGSQMDESAMFQVTQSGYRDIYGDEHHGRVEMQHQQATMAGSALDAQIRVRVPPSFDHVKQSFVQQLGSPATPRRQKRCVNDFGIILIGSSQNVAGFVLNSYGSETLLQTVHLPHDYTRKQLEVCIFNQSRDITGHEAHLMLGLRNDNGEVLWQSEHSQTISERCASILLSFPLSLVSRSRCFDLALIIRKSR